MRTLTPEDMTEPAMAVRIARRLKQFHTAPITLHGSNEGKAEPFKTLWKWCALKSSSYQIGFGNAPLLDHPRHLLLSQRCHCVRLRLDMAKEIRYADEEKQRAHNAVDLGAMARELALTEEKSAQLQSPVVWSHNDLLSGNILVSKQVLHPETVMIPSICH